MKRINHVTLSGRNNLRDIRTVYLDDVEIGSVVPVVTHDGIEPWETWEARDLSGQSHGDRYLTDWYAADALSRSPRQGSPGSPPNHA